MLAYLAYGVLYLAVALAQQFLGLLFGPAQYLLALLLNFLDAVLIAGYAALQVFLMLMYGLALALPVSLVAHNVLQIFVALYVLRTHDVAGVAYHLFGQTSLAGYLYGKA